MIVRVKLFALAAQLAAAEEVDVQLEADGSIGDLRRAIADKCPALERIMPHLMFAINSEYAADSTQIPLSAEIACIPPVSGG